MASADFLLFVDTCNNSVFQNNFINITDINWTQAFTSSDNL